MDNLVLVVPRNIQCTLDIQCIHGYPAMDALLVCTNLHVHVLRIYNVSMDIQRCSMDALLDCTTVHVYVHVLRIYIVSMDIQSCSMDALLVCTTVHVHVHCKNIMVTSTLSGLSQLHLFRRFHSTPHHAVLSWLKWPLHFLSWLPLLHLSRGFYSM